MLVQVSSTYVNCVVVMIVKDRPLVSHKHEENETYVHKHAFSSEHEDEVEEGDKQKRGILFLNYFDGISSETQPCLPFNDSFPQV